MTVMLMLTAAVVRHILTGYGGGTIMTIKTCGYGGSVGIWWLSGDMVA
jgi:hypothetical protein